MADTQLQDLSALTTAAVGDLLYIVSDPGGTPAPKKITIANLKTSIFASPTLVTPTLGVASATSINKVAITAPATGSTLTIADGKTLTVSNTLRFVGTDTNVITFQSGSQTVAALGLSNLFTTAQTIQPLTDVISLTVRRNGGSQTANIIEIQDESNNLLVGVNKSGAFSFPDNVRQTFNPGANAAGINVGAIAGDPDTPSNGDVWYNSSANKFRKYENGAASDLDTGGGGGAPTDATYITQTANGSLSAEQALSSLSTGLMKVTTTTGVISSITDSAGLAGVISDETGSGKLVFDTAPVFPTTITVGAASGATGQILLKGTTSGTVTLKTADAAGTYSLTLPTDDGGPNQFLQTNGSGVLTWADGGAGGGATTALDNLASVAINTAPLPGTDASIALGSATKRWTNAFLSGSLIVGANATAVSKISAGSSLGDKIGIYDDGSAFYGFGIQANSFQLILPSSSPDFNFGTGSSGSFTTIATLTGGGQFSAKSVRGVAVAFASVPASPVEGMLVAVTDSTTATWGATITGGGSNHVLAYYNGTNWTVAGK